MVGVQISTYIPLDYTTWFERPSALRYHELLPTI